jgi:plastocyanin
MRNRRTFAIGFGWVVAVVLVCQASALRAEGWGTLQVKFVYDGNPSAPKPLQITKDQEFCGKFNVVDETVVVNPANKGLANVVVFLNVARTDRVKPQVHPELSQQLKNQAVKLDNNHCRFNPHIAVVWTEQKVELANSDTVAHNTNIASINPSNPPINQLIPAQRSIEHRFSAAENVPIPVSCNIHPWMKAFLVVRDNPYAAVSNQDGVVTIEKIPAGKWKFRFWQESVGYLTKVTVNGKPATWNRGELEVEIKDGQVTDLGTVAVPASAFK